MIGRGERLDRCAAWLGSMVATAIAVAVWGAPASAQEPATSESPAAERSSDTTEPNSENTNEPSSAQESESQAQADQDTAPEDVELRDPTEIAPGARLHATLDLVANYTDNFFYSNRDEQGVFGWWLTPSVSYSSSSPRFRSTTAGGATIGMYSLGGTADDYRDLRGLTNASWKIAPDHRIGYDIGLNQGHDPWGLVRTEQDLTTTRSLDRWYSERYTVEYRYGAPRASFAVENKASVFNKSYRTNRATLPPTQQTPFVQFGTEYLDNDIESLDSTLLYQYSPKTSGQLNFATAHVHFDKQFPGLSRDAQEYHVRAGVRWIATAKTTGDFRIGYMTRHFSQSEINGKPVHNYNRFDWVITGDWMPFTRTSLQLQTGRQSVESYNEALFIDNTYVNLTWRQEWTRRLSSSVHGGFNNGDFAHFVAGSRTDRNFALNLRVDYRLMPRVVVYGGYDLDNRSSQAVINGQSFDGEFDYDKNTVYVGLQASY